MTLKRLMHGLVHSHPLGGVGIVLEAINRRRVNKMTRQSLINKINPESNVDNLNIDDFEKGVDSLDANFDVAQHFADKFNGIVVRMPSVPEGDLSLLDDFMSIAKEIGDISQRFQQAFADGQITMSEFASIDKEIKEAVAALVRFTESVKLRVVK